MRHLARPMWPIYLAAGLAALAAQLHAYVLPEHFQEWWGYGAAFLAMVIFQDIFAVLLLSSPRRPVYLLGIAGTLAMVSLWFVSRFVGLPLGPSAGELEPVGLLDAVTQTVEIVLIVALALLAQPRFVTHSQRAAHA
ncbi:MAG TPA: hypothetical protein VFI42_04030 [Thermomicrobiaceae bacterium]|nr:hypothetical protein [Thermomicrobiaceae bacterium]